MRTLLPLLAAGLALGLSGGALADEATTSTPQPVSYSSNDGITCHHMVHEGEVTSVVQCHSQAGWERLRHVTQQSIYEFQIHALVEPGRK